MNRPATHKWLPFYFWILLGGIGPTIIEIFKALNIEGSGGYIFDDGEGSHKMLFDQRVRVRK